MNTRYFPRCRTLVDTITFHSRNTPGHAAVLTIDDSITYSELDRASNRLARALAAAGAVRGSRVAVIAREDGRYYEILFAVAKIGAVIVPANWRLSVPEIEHILTDSGARFLFTDGSVQAPDLGADLQTVRLDTDEYASFTEGHDDSPVVPDTGENDPIAQLYTSGTTGLPKGVVLPQRSFFAIADLIAEAGIDWIDWRDGDVSLVGLPGFHVGGLWWAIQGFRAGITNAVMPSFTADNALALIGKYSVTTACMAASMMQMLISSPGVSRQTFSSIRKIIYGGSPIGRKLLQQCIVTFDCDFAQIYGLTETGNTAVCLPPDQHRLDSPRLLAAGRPYPGVECRIVDETGRPLAPGRSGEVHLRTPARMLEYWNLPEATGEVLVDGWIATGDAGYLDDEGYLYIQDRVKDMIITAGENVYPAEVENVLSSHPDLTDVAVIGVPDDRWGEAVHAFIVPNPGVEVNVRDLVEYARPRLAAFKLPSAYHRIDSVPRNPSGKILRRELRTSFWADQERQIN